MPFVNTSLLSVPVVETARLLLRGYQAEDYAAYVAMCQEPAFFRYLSPEPTPAEEVWKLLLRGAGHWAVMGYGFWAVEEKATGQFLGTIGFGNLMRDIDPPIGNTPEIGWVLAPHAHGQGYATEAVTAALAWATEHFGPVRTMCIIDPENEASLWVAAKFGYREYALATYKNKPILMLERAGNGA